MADPFAAGGFLVTDTVLVEPGCWNGLDTWRDWLNVLDGTGCAHFGHDPFSMAERVGDIVRLTVEVHGTGGSLVTELLVADAEQDMQDFLSLAGPLAEQDLPEYATPATAALARALDLAHSP
ncbi:hypothetical protein [Streptomyces sp. NPDC017524]|uniref:hypothetical protein n=1 Tax=unclassified Streptomyces TaxID=2593676 RepID=UPI003794159C